MSLKQKQYPAIAALVLGILLAILADGTALRVIGILLLAFGLILDVALIRCPKCGIWLGKYPGEYCKNCGEKIDWNKRSK